jgi:hypothetical protein
LRDGRRILRVLFADSCVGVPNRAGPNIDPRVANRAASKEQRRDGLALQLLAERVHADAALARGRWRAGALAEREHLALVEPGKVTDLFHVEHVADRPARAF